MSEELKAAQARIACLEGEIAKRDETIARLVPPLNRAVQANYDLREELAACRVAVENCDLFRARIAELDRGLAYYKENLDAAYEDRTSLREELAALKAQEPDCDRSACGDFSPGPCDNPDCSARRDRTVVAPAAKAQGVALDGSQLAGLLEQVRLDDDEAKPHGSGATYWNNAVIACQVAIRDALADHVQQVIVPDGWRVERGYSPSGYVLHSPSGSMIRVCDSGGGGIETAFALFLKAMLIAAPAADAGVNDHE